MLVVSTETKRMEVIPDNCVGCHLCEIACSRVKFNVANPERSYIRVEPREGEPGYWDAWFTSDCDVCAYCVSFCAFDAIRLNKLEPAVSE